jgi:hypothetical protein
VGDTRTYTKSPGVLHAAEKRLVDLYQTLEIVLAMTTIWITPMPFIELQLIKGGFNDDTEEGND